MLHLLTYEFKRILRSRDTLFWGILFPVAYISFFVMALGGLTDESGMLLKTIKVAIVDEENAAEMSGTEMSTAERDGQPTAGEQSVADLAGTLNLENMAERGVSSFEKSSPESLTAYFDEINKYQAEHTDSEQTFLEYRLTDEQEALALLEKEEIHALIKLNPELELIAGPKASLYPSIIKQLLNSYNSIQKSKLSIFEAVAQGVIKDPSAVLQNISQAQADFKGLDTAQIKKGINPDKIYFFTMLAYIAFYPIGSGADVVESTEPNQNKETMRKRLGPVSKTRIFISSLLPNLIFQIILIILIYLYTQILGVDYGTHHGANILLVSLGTIAAIFTGTTLAAYTANHKGLRMALSITLPLLFAFLNGMMVSRIYEILKEKIPVIFDIMPVGLVSQGLYILNMEGVSGRFYQKTLLLCAYSVFFLILTLIGIRRSRYESI